MGSMNDLIAEKLRSVASGEVQQVLDRIPLTDEARLDEQNRYALDFMSRKYEQFPHLRGDLSLQLARPRVDQAQPLPVQAQSVEQVQPQPVEEAAGGDKEQQEEKKGKKKEVAPENKKTTEDDQAEEDSKHD